jgi:hypothetical protein
MKACKLVINDKYMYTGGAVYMEVKHTGFDRNGYIFYHEESNWYFSLSGLGVKEFIQEIN